MGNEAKVRQSLLQDYKDKQDLLNKNYDELTERDKYLISRDDGILGSAYDIIAEKYNQDDKQALKNQFKDWKQSYLADEVIAPDVLRKIEFLNNIHSYKGISSILRDESSEQAKALKNDYLDNVLSIAELSGFNDIATNDKGDLFFEKQGNYYKVNDGFIRNFASILESNTGSIGAGIAMAIKEGRKFNPATFWKSSAILGAKVAGASALGASADYVIANQYLNRENNFNELLRHATQEGLLSFVGDLGAGAVAKGASKIANAKGLTHLKDSIMQSQAFEKANDLLNYMPIVGFGIRAIDGNAKAVKDLVRQSVSKEQQESIREFSKVFGGELDISVSNKMLDSLKNKLGENSKIYQGAEKIHEIITLQKQGDFQVDLLKQIRADESGNLIAFLAEAANASPIAQKQLVKILNSTSENLTKRLNALNLETKDIQNIFNQMEKGTKESYKTAMGDILGNIYDESYTTTLNRSGWEAFKADLAKQGIDLSEAEKRYINFVDKSIYNPQGVTFNQLRNAEKTLNSYYKSTQDPNFRTYMQSNLENFLKNDIRNGIDSIFAQNPTMEKDAKKLFETALNDYAKMKDTLRVVDKLKLRDEATNYNKALKNLFNYTQGIGGDTNNLKKLLDYLPQQNKEVLEMHLLNDIAQASVLNLRSDLKVFDSNAFFSRLESLKPMLSSKYAHEYIDLAQGFHKLFKNDANIAKSVTKALIEKTETGLATTLSGAAKFQAVKIAFANIFRLMPYVPMMKGLNEKVQGAALRYHIKAALNKSIDIADFNAELNFKLQKGIFNNETQALAKQIMENVAKADDEIEAGILKTIDKQIAKNAESKALDNTNSVILSDSNARHFEPQGEKSNMISEKSNMKSEKSMQAQSKEANPNTNLSEATTKEISNYKKFYTQIDKENITHTSTQPEILDFVIKVWGLNSKEDIKKAPNAIKVGTINDTLLKALNLTNGDTYLTKKHASHTKISRKGSYNQAISLNEFATIPSVLKNAREAYRDNGAILIPFESEKKGRVNLLVLNADQRGNLIVTGKNVDKNVLKQYKIYVKALAEGLEPSIPNRNSDLPSTTLTASTNVENILPQNNNLKQVDTKQTTLTQNDLLDSSYKLPTKTITQNADEAQNQNVFKQREETIKNLNNLIGKNITNANDGRIAQVTKKEYSKDDQR